MKKRRPPRGVHQSYDFPLYNPDNMSHINGLISLIRRFAKERDWEQFHSPKNLSMAMSVEAGEVAEIFQWLTEEQSRHLPIAKQGALKDELADVFIYLLKLSDNYKIDLIDAAFKKMRKNAKKYPVGKSRGNARKYTELS